MTPPRYNNIVAEANVCRIAHAIFNCILLTESVCDLLHMELKLFPKGPVD